MSALEGKADVMSASGKVANDPTQTLRSSYYLTGNRNASVVRNDQDDAPGWALDVVVGVDRSIDWLVADLNTRPKPPPTGTVHCWAGAIMGDVLRNQPCSKL
jgi:ferric-dicitrate binding protein FerR (iron transport regulator)